MRLIQKLIDNGIPIIIAETSSLDGDSYPKESNSILLIIYLVDFHFSITITFIQGEKTPDYSIYSKDGIQFQTNNEKKAINFLETMVINPSVIKGGKRISKTFLLKSKSILEQEDFTSEEEKALSDLLKESSQDTLHQIEDEIAEEYELSESELNEYAKLVEQIAEGKITEEEFNKAVNQLQRGKIISKLYHIKLKKLLSK